jgi:hypothetical protein
LGKDPEFEIEEQMVFVYNRPVSKDGRQKRRAGINPQAKAGEGVDGRVHKM